MKNLLIAIVLLSAVSSNAQKVIKIKINNKIYKVLTLSTSVSPSLDISSNKLVKAKSLSVEVLNETAIDAYKITLEIQDSLANTLIISTPDKSNKKLFVFDLSKIKTVVSKNKGLLFYENYEPVNPMMRIRSKRALLLLLHIN